jgi:hypothetical protein
VTGGVNPGRVSPFRNPRINARLPASRGLSQAPTSFVASRCQDIHRAPLVTWPPPPAAVNPRAKTRRRPRPPQGVRETRISQWDWTFRQKRCSTRSRHDGKTSSLGERPLQSYSRADRGSYHLHFTLNLVFTCQRARRGHDTRASHRVTGERPMPQSIKRSDVLRFRHRLNASDHYVACWQSVRRVEQKVLAVGQAHLPRLVAHRHLTVGLHGPKREANLTLSFRPVKASR